MAAMRLGIIAVCGLTLAGCNAGSSDEVTLYRNSPMDATVRVHFATFDAEDLDFNFSNCQMTARLLNANVNTLAGRDDATDQKVGFWCETGSFTEEGMTPISFGSEFPTDTENGF